MIAIRLIDTFHAKVFVKELKCSTLLPTNKSFQTLLNNENFYKIKEKEIKIVDIRTSYKD